MSSSTMIAPFAVHQATTDIEKQIEFYKGIEFVVDDGWEPVETIPETYWEARGISGKDLKRTVAMKLPADPYMHLVLYEWSNLKTTPGWPCPFNQIGSRGISLLVEDVAAELSRIRKDWPQIRILQDPISIRRKWGHTASALVLDPEHVFLELISIEKGSSYDPSNVKAPTSCDRVWLHFMHMCTSFHITEPFYKSFGMEHDHGVDFRPKSGFHPFSFEHFNQQMKDAFGYDMTLRPSSGPTVSFLRTERDCSQMHIELIKSSEDRLQVPGPKPTWTQRGIARYCFKTIDYAGALAEAKQKGTHIYVDDQRACLNWGDSQWFFFGDLDGNIRTLEEWFPHRQWGERD